MHQKKKTQHGLLDEAKLDKASLKFKAMLSVFFDVKGVIMELVPGGVTVNQRKNILETLRKGPKGHRCGRAVTFTAPLSVKRFLAQKQFSSNTVYMIQYHPVFFFFFFSKIKIYI